MEQDRFKLDKDEHFLKSDIDFGLNDNLLDNAPENKDYDPFMDGNIDYQDFEPKAGQDIAIRKMIKWWHSKLEPGKPTNRFMTLSGSAGTGKTTVTKAFLRCINMMHNAKVTAPTHKAKKIIARATECDAITIQALLGLAPNYDIDDFDINNPQFDPKGENQMRYSRLVIIDESSMLSADLFDYVIKCATRESTKVLFLGDILQLPPVKESLSKVFTEVAEVVTLTEIVRQANTNPIAKLLVMIRDDITNDTNNFRKYLRENQELINDKGEGFKVYPNHEDFLAKADTLFSSPEVIENPDYVRYSAYTNESISKFNKFIRGEVQSPLLVDELMMAYSTVKGETKYSPDLLVNSEDYIIHGMKYGINMYGIDVIEATIYNPSLATTNTINIVDPSNYKEFISQHTAMLSKAIKYKGSAWVKYFAFRRENILMTDVKDHKGKILVKKDIDYGSGITVHKTQGSTYENIMINGDNLDKNSNSEECKKLWYVALSRCSKMCHILYQTL